MSRPSTILGYFMYNENEDDTTRIPPAVMLRSFQSNMQLSSQGNSHNLRPVQLMSQSVISVEKNGQAQSFGM